MDMVYIIVKSFTLIIIIMFNIIITITINKNINENYLKLILTLYQHKRIIYKSN